MGRETAQIPRLQDYNGQREKADRGGRPSLKVQYFRHKRLFSCRKFSDGCAEKMYAE